MPRVFLHFYFLQGPRDPWRFYCLFVRPSFWVYFQVHHSTCLRTSIFAPLPNQSPRLPQFLYSSLSRLNPKKVASPFPCFRLSVMPSQNLLSFVFPVFGFPFFRNLRIFANSNFYNTKRQQDLTIKSCCPASLFILVLYYIKSGNSGQSLMQNLFQNFAS